MTTKSTYNREAQKRYRQKNKDKIAHTLRKRLSGFVKNGSSLDNLGCLIVELKQYLQSKFQPGMTWENHGEWHIDHMKPLSKFDLSEETQLKEACHFTNLQPLWAEDNLKKSDNLC